VAEGPATPELKVVATIEQPAKQNGACLISAEIRDPQSNAVLAAPKLAVAAGEQANASSSESDRKVEVTVKAGPGCAGGTYVVNVWASGKLAYTKNGALKLKAQ
jgi:flagellar basal body rod protein FlgF